MSQLADLCDKHSMQPIKLSILGSMDGWGGGDSVAATYNNHAWELGFNINSKLECDTAWLQDEEFEN